MGEALADQRTSKVHKGTINNAPSDALISQPKVEFPKMAHRILLIHPPDPLTDRAKAALKPILDLLQKSIICQTRLEASLEFHPLDLGELETTNQSFQRNFTLEGSGNPLAGEFRPATQPAHRFQLKGVRFVLGCWLLSRLVIDSPGRPLPFTGNTRLVACHSAGLRSLAIDLMYGRRVGYRCLLGFNIGSQRAFKGACFNICGSRGGLMETDQKYPSGQTESHTT